VGAAFFKQKNESVHRVGSCARFKQNEPKWLRARFELDAMLFKRTFRYLDGSWWAVVDRDGVEKFLRVSRRDAIRLLHRFGGLSDRPHVPDRPQGADLRP
jgi:hypothetical protein